MAFAGGGRMIGLWLWWYGQMAALLPQRWRTKQPDSLHTLRLPDRRPWRRHFSLPRAAAPFLRQILRNEMDRRTPWQADQVYFTAAAEKSQEAGQLAITLTVLPRRWAEPALAALAARGLQADRIQLEEAGPTLSLADGEPLAEIGNGKKPALILAAVAAVALLSLIVQAVWVEILDLRLAGARHEAAAARSLANEADALRRRQHFPSFQRDATPSAIAILNRVSRALPDDSWVDEAEIKDRQITLGGISAEPAKLLALLQGAGLSGVEFAAPVTPAQGGGQRFQIRARIAGADHDFR
jgi:general secretion pathway protein L